MLCAGKPGIWDPKGEQQLLSNPPTHACMSLTGLIVAGRAKWDAWEKQKGLWDDSHAPAKCSVVITATVCRACLNPLCSSCRQGQGDRPEGLH